jgi:cation diffusion facilitator family transporter
MKQRAYLIRFGWLAILTAVATIALKVMAYLLTGSVGLLSDALESGVNLVAAIMALAVLTIAARPPDEDHAYGHDKAEYFSGGAEGTLILVAALTIAYSAVRRLLFPQPLEQLGVGLGVSVLASLLNLGTAMILRQAGRQHRSITLEAHSRHLLTDVWTSAGVIVGVGAVLLTGWQFLDPLVAFLVAAQIVYSGIKLVSNAVNGLMDTALPAAEIEQIEAILKRRTGQGVQYHALRTRQSAAQRFVSAHIQVPGNWSVQRGHTLIEEIEREVRHAISPISILIHLEPVEDPRSWEDIPLNREDGELER